MARQIIFARPQTDRAAAFNRDINKASDAVGNLFAGIATERQKAFDQAMRMREAGYDVSPEQVQEARMGGDDQNLFKSLFETRTPEFEEALRQKQEQRQREQEWQDTQRGMQEAKFMKSMEEPETVPFEQTADYKKMMLKQAHDREMAGLRQGQKQESDLAKQEAKNRELEINIGSGRSIMGRTKDEAKKLRDAVTEGKKAFDTIDEIKKLGTDVAVWDVGRTSKINALKNILAGQLRTAILGPGIMDKSEFNRLIDTMGDPTRLTSTENIEFGKLDQLKNILQSGLEGALESKAVGYKRGSLFESPSQQYAGSLQPSNSQVPHSPVNAPEMMPDAMASQGSEEILLPERTQFRQSRIQQLRAKQQGR